MSQLSRDHCFLQFSPRARPVSVGWFRWLSAGNPGVHGGAAGRPVTAPETILLRYRRINLKAVRAHPRRYLHPGGVALGGPMSKFGSKLAPSWPVTPSTRC
jgi:hypothetical protein